ncbi:hypothetical protein NSTC745_06411 [Nostoc sp. DSM 114161]|uniref:hypothetical protein n=1 Tax=Nostoc sp. DSM 114161 TaxID=3440143 RepID=UPI004045E025
MSGLDSNSVNSSTASNSEIQQTSNSETQQASNSQTQQASNSQTQQASNSKTQQASNSQTQQASNSQTQQGASTLTGTKPVANLHAQLNLSDCITSVPISQKIAEEIAASAAKQRAKSAEQRETTRTKIAKSAGQRETTRTKLAILLTKFFGLSVGTILLSILFTTFTPNADKTTIKDLISQIIPPQVTLLSFALGFYFGSNKEN